MSNAAPQSSDHPSADADDQRDETESERSDRNWIDLLQELRVLQAGTQILTAFLLAIAFQPRFTELDDFQRMLYLALVSVSILTTILSLLPVSLHRLLFRRQLKGSTVAIGDAMVRAVLVGVSLTTIGTAMLIFDFVVSRAAGFLAAGSLTAVLVTLGLVLPLVVRRGSPPDPDGPN
ncbi:DUF6328 family protein [Mycetocola zhadangensis]|uniref:Sodium:proton antiporter n=1 Tax=Mycetocola zhadangensis TaxID=1164595 RepID=A0A3L7J664_9MICO|nr:DUF6328 family protein [Mycetocola zhadangensis]RLQ86147.1 sodium:proton antiporter [Mycetocola zhadangensis]GGE88798.1 hypothetical protein GCM10011313_09330 [Mycetocola zhadangensis]